MAEGLYIGVTVRGYRIVGFIRMRFNTGVLCGISCIELSRVLRLHISHNSYVTDIPIMRSDPNARISFTVTPQSARVYNNHCSAYAFLRHHHPLSSL